MDNRLYKSTILVLLLSLSTFAIAQESVTLKATQVKPIRRSITYLTSKRTGRVVQSSSLSWSYPQATPTRYALNQT